jgi:hypothetical protein
MDGPHDKTASAHVMRVVDVELGAVLIFGPSRG